MNKFIFAYVATAIVFVAADFLWLGVIARSFYKDQLGPLLSAHPSMPVAALFYGLYLVGVVLFGVAPGLRADSLTTALAFGAAFGFFAYATYDLTNLATLRDWPAALTFVDLAWGTVVTGAAASCGYLAGAAFG